MKKLLALTLTLISLSFTLTACSGSNYPGEVKIKYWVSEDETIVFWFPAEAGHGNAQGEYVVDENTKIDLILEWNTISGTVDVKTASYEKIFTANTTTDTSTLTCTFEITSQEDGYNFPTELIFNWKENIN